MLVVSETSTSTNHYHLRRVRSSGVKTGGGLSLLSGDEGKALCGACLGWDTQIPVKAFGTKDGFSHWCSECERIARVGAHRERE